MHPAPMALSRERALRVRNVLDDWLPPVLRDSKWLMYPLLYLLFGARFRYFADFKRRGFALSPQEFARVYEATSDLQKVQGATDLNEACIDAILESVVGTTVIDVGCGRGYLAEQLASLGKFQVTGCDIVLEGVLRGGDAVEYRRAAVEDLPFAEDSFDTVVCTHTLEHVQHIQRALSELRRVTKHRLIVVVPKERPYRYSFNLHLHFFPYAWSWQAVAGVVANAQLKDLGDWFYVEDVDVAGGANGRRGITVGKI